MRTRFLKPNWVKWSFVVAGVLGGNAEAQNKNAIYYGPTHNPEHVAANVAGISPIGAGSVIWTPGDPNPALDWDLKTVADFKNYDVIVISDTGDELEPNSKIANPAVWAGAIRNAAVWSQATTGNILVVGTDPENHVREGVPQEEQDAAAELIRRGILFAANDGLQGPGLYVALAQVEHDAASPLDATRPAIPHLLSGFGSFKVVHSIGGSAGRIVKVATAPDLNYIHGLELSAWENSVHNAFHGWPTSFYPMTVQADVPGNLDPKQLLAVPAAQYNPPLPATPYILARGLTREFTLTRGHQGKLTGSSVVLTATLKALPAGNGLGGQRVVLRVLDGPNSGVLRSGVTTSSGSATFTYPGGSIIGTDNIVCFLDENADNIHNDNEASTSAQVEWGTQVVMVSRSADASEPATNGKFRLTRQGPTTYPLAVRIHPEGTASHSADYTFSEYTFDRTIPANATGTDVYVNVIDDTELEGTEYVVMWVISDGSFAVDYQAATVSIADNDLGPVVSVSALADPSASEVGNDPAKYRITRTGSLDFPLEVRFTLPTGSGRALLGSDYLLADGTGADVQDRVTIPAGSEWLR